MTATMTAEAIVDYARFDFPALWAGRDRVSDVERRIVRQLLSGTGRQRILEVGAGFGRLTGTLAGPGREVVSTDLDIGALGRFPSEAESAPFARVAANLYHLPFVDGAFTGGTMIRLHHHLLDPVAALREVGRVLRTHSPLVVSYQPRPSVGTLLNDLERAVRRPSERPARSVTFSRGNVVLLDPPFPIRCVSRAQFRSEADEAGFEVAGEVGVGFEEYAPLRRFSAESFVRLGERLGRAPAFPTRFAVLRKRGDPDGPIPPVDRILGCPKCGAPRPEWSHEERLECDRCSYVGARSGSLLDLRFVPPGTARWEATDR